MTRLRVFLSSPTDLVDERGIALSVIDDVAYEPEFLGRAVIEAVAWDDLGSGRPVFATEPPQASLARGKRRPADCDVVVVMFWSRMGTPLAYPEYQKSDGSPYLSGTEWEYLDALEGYTRRGRPLVLLYRRQPMPGLDVSSATFEEDLDQQRQVLAFFDAQRDAHGAILSGTNIYAVPEEFRQLVQRDLRFALAQLVSVDSASEEAARPAVWAGSPFPGLRPFTPRDAPIFFGRGRNTDTVLERLSASRFVAVVGASGSGKSSLVGAGVIPRLAALAIPGVDQWWLPEFDPDSGRWSGLRFTPGGSVGDPFVSLAEQVAPALGVGRAADAVAAQLRSDPGALTRLVGEATADRDSAVETLVFIDQFEELFTIAASDDVTPFVRLLMVATMAPNLRIVLTMRSDFYSRCLEEPALAVLLEYGHVPLPRPSATLSEMIERPAFRAGLRFEEGLVDRILRDAGRELASLPLLAYTLDELYRASGPTGELTAAAYARVGGLHGAIGSRADAVFESLDDASRRRFADVFSHLVEIDVTGRVTRRRADLGVVAPDRASRQLVDAFTDGGLLVTESATSADAAPVVSVAHEALFDSWPRLRRWLAEVREDLLHLRTVTVAAEQWVREGRPDSHRWPHERVVPVLEAVDRLGATLEADTAAFLEPEHVRLLQRLRSPRTPAHQKQVLADRLVAIGEAAVDALADTLEDPDPVVRGLVTSTLARIGEASRSHVAAVIANGSADARVAAISAAVELGDERLVPAVSGALGHEDVRVRSLARGALGALGGEGAVDALAADLLRAEFDDRWEAAGALAALGSSAAPALAAAMTTRTPRIRAQAQRAANAAGAALVPGAVPLLSSLDGSTRLGAARLLAAVGRPALEALRAARGSDDVEVRALAVATIAAISDLHGLEDLVAASEDESVDVRRAAALGLVPLADETTVPTLLALLDDEDATVRHAAAGALRGVGSAIGPALAERLRAKEPRGVRLDTARRLAVIGAPVADVFAAQAQVEADESVRRHLIGAIGEFGSEAVAPLVRLVAAAPPAVADEAAIALTSLGGLAAEALLELAQSDDVAVRRRAVAGLAATHDDRAAPILAGSLRESDAVIRQSAATALASFGETAVPTLIRALSEPVAEVREAASIGLAASGGVAVPSLLAAMETEGFDRDTVVTTLRAIGTPAALLGLASADGG